MNELQKNSIQFDYFSKNYKNFEKDFYKFADINVPLTFLVDDILYYLSSSNRNYFMLNKKNSKDNKEHYFFFERTHIKENKNIIRFSYLGHRYG